MNVEKTGAASSRTTASTSQARSSGNGDFANIMKSANSGTTQGLDAIFEQASQKYGISVDLLRAVAKAESNFNPNATSHCGAMGVMQLMPGTAAGLGVTDPYNPEQNIMGGAKYLSQLMKRFDGDARLALAAYNAGSNNVIKYGGIPPFAETQNYVEKVMGYLSSDVSAGSITTTTLDAKNTDTFTIDGVSQSGDATGALLKYALLSGVFGNSSSSGTDSMSDLLSSLNSDEKDSKDLKNTIMNSVYQLQLKMLQSNDEGDGSGFIV